MEQREIQQEKYNSEVITLPSNGHFYPEDSILSSGQIRMKYPTGKSEDILTSKNLINKGIVIDEFLKSIIVDKINYDDLLLGDKNGLFIASRILLYGQEYKVQVKCPNCGESSEKTYDLSDLESKELDFEKYPKGINEFDFTLPFNKINIKFRFLTHKDETNINFQLKRIKKGLKTDIDQEITTRLSYVITSYNNETSQQKIFRLVSDEMSTRDSKAFRDHLIDITPGINTDVGFLCDSCGHEQLISLPMDINFFWPTGRL
ncbi:MAG TPA: hypothetical protein DC057_05215 [Spirochaetia bacterium]|nr:hypothetical protein [Spirochaetia bacterium]